jgi:hypothetical protein
MFSQNLEEQIDHECDYLQSNSFYLEDGSPDDEYDSSQNHDLHWIVMLVQMIIFLMMHLFQSSKLMTIILQWQKQQKIRITLKKLLGEMNHQ